MEIEKKINTVADYYLLYGRFITNIGLFNGKMGLVIFFFHYYKYTNSLIYKEIAELLFDDIIDNIHVETPLNFANGLAGIGWGISYLHQKKILIGDINECLKEIDEKILSIRWGCLENKSLNYGLTGYIIYIFSRIKNDHSNFYMEYIDELLFLANKLSFQLNEIKSISHTDIHSFNQISLLDLVSYWNQYVPTEISWREIFSHIEYEEEHIYI